MAENKYDTEMALKSTIELGFNTFLELSSEYGSDILKEKVKSVAVEYAIDASSSLIPGVSGAVQSYKRRRFERNIQKALDETFKRLDEIHINLKEKSREQQKEINKMYEFVMDYVIDEPQENKIKYLIKGFVNLTRHENITEDFVLTYYNLMSDLRLVDLAVLRIYCYIPSYNQHQTTYKEISKEFQLTIEQYNAVRLNLARVGLLTTSKELEQVDDLKKIIGAIENIYKYLERLEEGKKRLPKLKKLNIKTRERYKISKFGREFYNFFLGKNHELEIK